MRVTDKLSLEEKREIETMLISEMDRLERTPGLFESNDDEFLLPAWGNSPVSDGVGKTPPSTVRERVIQYQALVDALHRLRTGNYGHCSYCGGLIAASRLLVIPETEHCGKCGRLS